MEKRSLLRSVSAQVLKLQETSSDQAYLDLTETLHPLKAQWRSLQNLVNMPVSSDTEEVFQKNPCRWKSYSEDDLGSLDTFSEGLGLSRDDVMDSRGDAVYEDFEDPIEAAEDLIIKLNEFRERLHCCMYNPGDALYEVERKLSITQKVKHLFMK